MLKHWAALTILALDCATTIYPITNEPHHHLVLQTHRVRVFDVHVAPGTSTRIHEHDYDYLFITLGDATVTSTPYRGTPSHLALHDGDVRFTKAPLIHAASDDGTQPFHNVTIELLQPASHVTACAAPCVMTSDQWTVRSVTLPPGGSVDAHDGLAVALEATALPTQGAFTNTSAAAERVMLLEFK
jgi:quercetin dioxygenase-like cupin family protein